MILAENLLSGTIVKKNEAKAAVWIKSAEEALERETQATWVIFFLSIAHPRFLDFILQTILVYSLQTQCMASIQEESDLLQSLIRIPLVSFVNLGCFARLLEASALF